MTTPATTNWFTTENLWIAFGFLAQTMFFCRFLFQWIASEKKKESTVPVIFWWFSLAGGLMLFSYAAHRKDPVFMLGQATGILIYLRNLVLIYRKRSSLPHNTDTPHHCNNTPPANDTITPRPGNNTSPPHDERTHHDQPGTHDQRTPHSDHPHHEEHPPPPHSPRLFNPTINQPARLH